VASTGSHSDTSSATSAAHAVRPGHSRTPVRVTVYTAERCPYCVRATRLLSTREIPFTEVELDAAGRAALVERTGMMTVPQIVLDDSEFLGGYDQLAALDRAQGHDRLR
jgi:glutaredoxin 3